MIRNRIDSMKDSIDVHMRHCAILVVLCVAMVLLMTQACYAHGETGITALSLDVSPVAGSTYQLTANASTLEGTTVKYAFYIYATSKDLDEDDHLDPGEYVYGWTLLRAADDSNTYTWTCPSPGRYSFYVKAWSTDVYHPSVKTVTHTEVITDTSMTLTASPKFFANVGTQITYTAYKAPPEDCTTKYAFSVRYDGEEGWTSLQGFSPMPTCAWTPNYAGPYTIHVDAIIIDNEGHQVGDVIVREEHSIIGSQLTSLSLDHNVNPMVSDSVTWTATTSPTGTYEYAFYVDDFQSEWTMIRDFSTTNTCTWVPNTPGTYVIQVRARQQGSKNEWDTADTHEINVRSPLLTAKLVGTPSSPLAISQNVSLTATCTKTLPVDVEYQFIVYDGTEWTVIQEYVTEDTCTDTPPVGTSAVSVWIRQIGSRNHYDTFDNYQYYVKTQETPQSTVWMTASPFTSATLGTPVLLKAYGSNLPESSVGYQFSVAKETTSTILRDYDVSNTCLWTPTTAGTYTLTVSIKDLSTGPVIATGSLKYQIQTRALITSPEATTAYASTFVPGAPADPDWQWNEVPAISGDGNLILFQSRGETSASTDSNGEKSDVMQYNRTTNSLTRVNISSAGTQGDGYAALPSITPDGRFITFSSDARNFLPNDTNTLWSFTSNSASHEFSPLCDVFMRDTQEETTAAASIDCCGTEGDLESGLWFGQGDPSYEDIPAISADGRFITFTSRASNLVANDTNERRDVFVRDRTSGVISRLNSDEADRVGSISADGRYVVYQNSEDVTSNWYNALDQILLIDRLTGESVCVSVNNLNEEGDDYSYAPVLSANGRYLAFLSWAGNLVDGDENESIDCFVRDLKTGITTCASVDEYGVPAGTYDDESLCSISADGRYIVFSTDASLCEDDTNSTYDVYRFDRLTNTQMRVSVDSDGFEGDAPSDSPAISADGRFVAFRSLSQFNENDTDEGYDIYVRGPLPVDPPLAAPFPPYENCSPGGLVNLATGELDGYSETDMSVYNPLGPGASFTRSFYSYQAKQDYGSPGLSPGWVHNYDITLRGPIFPVAWSDLILAYPNGAIESLTPAEDPTGEESVSLLPPTGAPYMVSGVPSETLGEWTSVTITWSDGMQFTFVPCVNKDVSDYMPGVGTIYKLSQISDRVGNAITLEWDYNRRLTTIKNSAQAELLEIGYTNDQVTVTDAPSNRQVLLTKGIPEDSDLVMRCLLSSSRINDATADSAYEYINYLGQPLLSSITNDSPTPEENDYSTFLVEYDDQGRVEILMDENGSIEAYTYDYEDEDPDVISTLVEAISPDPEEGTLVSWIQRADLLGRDIGITETVETPNSTQIAYGDAGNPYLPTLLIEKDGKTTTIAYDAYGNITQVDDPLTTTTVSYDYTIFPLGLVDYTEVSYEDGENTITRREAACEYYSPSGLLKSVDSPKPGSTTGETVTTSITYTAMGNVHTVTAPGNDRTPLITTTYSYTDNRDEWLGLPTKVTDNRGNATRYTYDLRGNVTSVTDAEGRVTNITLNIADQVEEVQFPKPDASAPCRPKMLYFYQYVGGPLEQTEMYDESGEKVQQETPTYGKEGELLQVESGKEGNLTKIQYEYDALYRVKKLIDNGEKVTEYEYSSPLGYLTSVTYPGNRTTQFTSFDPAGRVLAAVDNNGHQQSFEYNERDGQLKRVENLTDLTSVEYHYDGEGKLEQMVDSEGVMDYHYSPDGRIASVDTTYTGLPTRTIGYEYTSDGSRKRMVTPAGDFTYQYDKLGRLSGLTNPLGRTSSWHYRADGKLDGVTLGNRASVAYAYDALGRVTGVTNRNPKGHLLSRFADITYDGSGNRIEMRTVFPGKPSWSGVTSYAYQPGVSRLTREDSTRHGSYLRQFSYDANGNATAYNGVSYAYNDANQFTGAGFVYDNNGNPTTYKGDTLTYDQNNRLTTYTTPLQGTVLEAGYRGDGLRAWKNGGGGRTYFLYDGTTLVCEMNASGQVTAVNTVGPTGLLARHERNAATGAVTRELWYTFDPQGNVAQRLDATGKVLSSDSYDAYGTRIAGGDDTDPYGYNGQWGYYTDRETGLILCTYRYYDPEVGRWLTEDPIGYEGGMNLYGYCGENPVMGTDRLGLTDDLDGLFLPANACTGGRLYRRAGAASPFTPAAWDTFQDKLSNVGMIPGLGDVLDVLNGGISLARGNKFKAAMYFGAVVPVGDLLKGARYLKQIDPKTGRHWSDILISRKMKEAEKPIKVWGRKVGKSVAQNKFVYETLKELHKLGAKDIRVNQQQVNALGITVGRNRPDLQFTLEGQRYYIELDTSKSYRGPGHASRILSNDPKGIVQLLIMD